MLNRVNIIGRVTKDLDLKTSVNGKNFCVFTLAVNNIYSKDQTYYIPVFSWEKLAEIVTKYARKGSLIAVDGKLTSRKGKDIGGVLAPNLIEVQAENIYFLESKNKYSSNGSSISFSDKDNLEFEQEFEDKLSSIKDNFSSNKKSENKEIKFEDDDSIVWD